MFTLSSRGRYIIRAMVELAINHGTVPIPLSLIEKNQGISKKYLTQLMGSLKIAGLVRVVRGKNGGFLLTRDPKLITMADMLYATEGDMSLVDCVADQDLCSKHEDCVARTIWVELSSLINNYLQSITLRDILNKGNLPEVCEPNSD